MNWNEYHKLLLEKCKQNSVPYGATFELTPFCNFRCNMCYIRLDPKEAALQGTALTTDQWLDIGKAAKEMGTLSLEVTGGEPLTRQDFPILYKSFINLGFLIILRSNGYLISGSMLELLKRYKPYKLFITLYGATDETYQKVCGISDGFTVVSKNILMLKEAGINIQLTSTLTADNVHEVDMMRSWAKDHSFSLTLAGMLFTPIRGAKRSIDHLRVKSGRDDKDLVKLDRKMDLQREIPNRASYMNPFWMCRGFGSKFNISWDGRMTLCNTTPSVWSNALRMDLAEAYQDLYRQLKALRRPKECETCPYIDCCNRCPASLYSATGSAEQTNDEVCAAARRHYYYKMQAANPPATLINETLEPCEEEVPI